MATTSCERDASDAGRATSSNPKRSHLEARPNEANTTASSGERAPWRLSHRDRVGRGASGRVDGLLAFANARKQPCGTAARAGADRAPGPTGCNPGCKVSATGGNCDQLEAALCREIPPAPTGSLRLGAGRSQVQILSPRFEAPANPIVLVGRVMTSRGSIGPTGSDFCNRVGNRCMAPRRHSRALVRTRFRSHGIDHVRTSIEIVERGRNAAQTSAQAPAICRPRDGSSTGGLTPPEPGTAGSDSGHSQHGG